MSMCNIHLSVSSHYLAWSWVCFHNLTIILRFEITTGIPHLIFTCSEAKKYSQGEYSGLKRRASTFPLGSWFHVANSDRWQVWWRVLLRRDRPRVQLSESLKFVQFGGHKKKVYGVLLHESSMFLWHVLLADIFWFNYGCNTWLYWLYLRS